MTLMAPVEAGVDLQIKPLARMAGGFFLLPRDSVAF
jgi:hypothetical protein